ncbi:MAG: hypothetical protein FWE21_10280 [Defluviitaleaceae bacterium]|nr:hypothetical protein [Defluviitaleaceae bacterium]
MRTQSRKILKALTTMLVALPLTIAIAVVAYGAPAIDRALETITGLAGHEYRIGTDGEWQPALGSTLDVSGLIPAAGGTTRVVYVSDDGGSTTTPFNLYPRASAPAPRALNPSDATINTTTAHQVRFGHWTWTNADANMCVEYLLGRPIYVRVAASGILSASLETRQVLPSRPAAPTGVSHEFDTDRIIGVSPQMEFRQLDAGEDQIVDWANVTSTFLTRAQFDSHATLDTVYVEIRIRAVGLIPASQSVTIQVPPSPAPAPSVSDANINFANETLGNVDNTMQFRRAGYTGAWTAVTGTTIPLNQLMGHTVHVRYAADGSTLASGYAAVVIPARPATPTAPGRDFAAATEVFTGTLTGLEFAENVPTATFFPLVAGDLAVLVGDANVFRIYVRNPSSAAAFASNTVAIPIPNRPATPNVQYNPAADAILGVTSLMEWSTNGIAWTAVEGNSITRTNLGAWTGGDLYVRIAHTATTPRSANAVVADVPGAGEAAPTGVINFEDETITGVAATMEWRVGTGPWSIAARGTAVVGTSFNIPANAFGNTIQIRHAGNGVIPGAIQDLPIPIRGTAPNAPGRDFDAEEFTGTLTGLEFAINAQTAAFNPLTPGALETLTNDAAATHIFVRAAATTAAFATDAVRVDTPNRPTTPTLAWNTATDVITITGAGAMEVRAGATGTWTAVTGTTIDRGLLNTSAGAPFGAGTVYVRVAHTATAPRSVNATQIVTAPPAAPTFNIDFALETLTLTHADAARGFQIRPAGGDWMPFASGATIATNIGTTIEVRLAAGGTYPPSQPVSIVLPARPAVMGASFDWQAETVVLGNANQIMHTMPITVGGDPVVVWTAQAANINAAADTIVSTAFTVQLRVGYTVAEFASLPVNINVPARAASPTNVAYNGAQDRITGVTTAMQFRVGAGTTAPTGAWLPVSRTFITRTAEQFDIVGGVDYHSALGITGAGSVDVRIAPTAARRASNVVNVTFPGGERPLPTGITFDLANERLVIPASGTNVTGFAQLQVRAINPAANPPVAANTGWRAVTADLCIASLIPAATATAPVQIQVRFINTADTWESGPANVGALVHPRAAVPAANSLSGFRGMYNSSVVENYLVQTANFTGTLQWRIPGAVQADGTTPHANASWTNASATINVGDFLGAARGDLEIRIAASADRSQSLPRTITMPARPSAPRLVHNLAQDTVTGVTTAMEWTTGTPTGFAAVTAAPLTRADFGDAATTVYARLLATTSAPTGLYGSVEVTIRNTTAPTGQFIDFGREVLLGWDSALEFATRPFVAGGTGAHVPSTVAPRFNRPTAAQLTDNGDALVLTSFIPAFNLTHERDNNPRPTELFVRTAATATAPAGDWEVFILNPRPRTPATSTAIPANMADHTVRFYGFTSNVLVNSTHGFEFRAGTAAATPWTPGFGNGFEVAPNLTANQTYQVRFAPTTTTFASLPFNVTVPRLPATPTVGATAIRFDLVTDGILGVSTAREFSVVGPNGPWLPVTATRINRASTDAAPGFGNAPTVWVRTAATLTAPASGAAELVGIHAAVPAPTSISIDWNLEVLTGVTTAHQISVNGGSTWLNVAAADIRDGGLNITGRIPTATAAAPAQILVRVAATGTTPPSAPTTAFVLPQRPATPAAADHRFNTVDRFIPMAPGMQVRDGAATAWGNPTANHFHLPAVGPARGIDVRVAPIDGVTFGSLHRTINVPAIANVGIGPAMLPLQQEAMLVLPQMPAMPDANAPELPALPEVPAMPEMPEAPETEAEAVEPEDAPKVDDEDSSQTPEYPEAA